MVEKIRPEAKVESKVLDSGRSECISIEYHCPGCNRRLSEGTMGCDICGIFFDWSKKAIIKSIVNIEWKGE